MQLTPSNTPRPVAYRYIGQKVAHVTGIPARDLYENELEQLNPVQLELAVACGLYLPISKNNAKKTPQKEVQVNE